jgi:hypothetical protein
MHAALHALLAHMRQPQSVRLPMRCADKVSNPWCENGDAVAASKIDASALLKALTTAAATSIGKDEVVRRAFVPCIKRLRSHILFDQCTSGHGSGHWRRPALDAPAAPSSMHACFVLELEPAFAAGRYLCSTWVSGTDTAGVGCLQRFMNLIHADTPIMFAGSEDPAAFLEVGACISPFRNPPHSFR